MICHHPDCSMTAWFPCLGARNQGSSMTHHYVHIPNNPNVCISYNWSGLVFLTSKLDHLQQTILVHLHNVSCMIQAAKVQDSTKRTFFLKPTYTSHPWLKHYRVECTLLYHIPFSHLQLNRTKLGYTFSDNYLLSSLPKTVAMHLTCMYTSPSFSVPAFTIRCC